MNSAGSDYGLWGLVVVNSIVFIGFAYMFGFLLQWPTLLTLAIFPVLVLMYVRPAIAEERDSEKAFGEAWQQYAAATRGSSHA